MVNYDGLYNKEFFGDKLTENHFSNKKLHFRIIENGTILPHKSLTPNGMWTQGVGGIIDDKRNFIQSSFMFNGVGGAYTPTEEIKYSNETVIYLGMFFHIWGHCISDNLKNLWFLRSEIYKKYFKNCRMVWVPMQNGGGYSNNFVELLKILNINLANVFPILSPIKFQTIILPDESFSHDITNGRILYTDEYVETIQQIRQFAKKNFSSISQKKFYFFHGQKQVGEERLASYFVSKGYSVVQPERIPFTTQLNILSNCESFVSTRGSISHNTLWTKEGTETILILRCTEINQYQETFNQINKTNVFYIDSALSTFCISQGTGPFCYIVSENLRKHFGDEITEKYTEEDFATFLAYFRYAKSVGLSENPQEIEYLKNILPEFMAQLRTHKDLIQKFGITIN